MTIPSNPKITYKELTLEQTRTDITLPLSLIDMRTSKTALYNINRVLNKTDIAMVDYTEGGTNGHSLEPLNNLFSDNIVLYYYIPEKEVAASKALTDFLNNCENLEKYKIQKEIIKEEQQSKETEYKESVNKFLDYIDPEKNPKHPQPQKKERLRGEIKEAGERMKDIKKIKAIRPEILQTAVLDKFEALKVFLGENTNKIKRIFNKYGLPIEKTNIKPTHPTVLNKRVAQMVKISLANCPYDKVLELITTHTQELEEEGLYVHDIDFTRDYKGVFNKQNLIKYLIEEKNFRMEGENGEEEKPTIINNNNLVSRNCSTFITTGEEE
jgi:hypothetical protein